MHKNIAWLLASVKLGFLVCFSLMGAAEVFAQSEAMVEIQYPCHQQSMAGGAVSDLSRGRGLVGTRFCAGIDDCGARKNRGALVVAVAGRVFCCSTFRTAYSQI